MNGKNRRQFVTQAGLALALGASVIERALAVPAARRTGTIRDVEHVVILMQENRSFDHYFGVLRGVRGFSDPRPWLLPSGKPVWHQPGADGAPVLPFHFDCAGTAAQWLESLDHSWKGSHAQWKNYDAWIAAKTPLTMGYFTRQDMPFYYALADAFTICDAYHCSIFGPTNPNRMFLFTGTNGLAVGNDGPQAIINPPDEVNETADQSNDGKTFVPYGWTTYAERLGAAGIDWRIYQEYDNFGDNSLAYFRQFRGLNPDSDAYRRARSWPAAAGKETVRKSGGDYLIAEFARDVAAGRLPQVSWIVAPTAACEHPEAPPAIGQAFVANLLAALTANPDVWSKTVLLLNYDENDGFFDHVPPPVPAVTPDMGMSGVAVTGEIYKGEPVGLGPRVPMLAISPWSRGGFVNSELFDHTSVIRFLEKRFGVMEPNITPWRRAVCGDLTSIFDFESDDTAPHASLPDTANYVPAILAARSLPPAQRIVTAEMPVQESGRRPARALPYAFEVTGTPTKDAFLLTMVNSGKAGVCLTVQSPKDGPWFYAIPAGQTLAGRLPLTGPSYNFRLYGPNGFLRVFEGTAPQADLAVATQYDARTQDLILVLRNFGKTDCKCRLRGIAYGDSAPRDVQLRPGTIRRERWPVGHSDHWYDLEIRSGESLWRLAGHIETGKPSKSDPALPTV